MADLIVRAPGTLAAAVVDAEGETVDYAGRLTPYEAKLAAAHMRIILGDVDARPALSPATLLAIRAERRTFVARPLPDGYALVLVRARRAFAVSPRPLAVCERALRREAGWEADDPSRPSWFDVDVALDPRRRPAAVESASAGAHRITVVGAIVGAAAREHGFRVRIESVDRDASVELNLLREPGDFWYADEDIAALLGAGNPDENLSPSAWLRGS